MKRNKTIWLLWILLFGVSTVLPILALMKLIDEFGLAYVGGYVSIVLPLTAILYWWDKRCAQKGSWRVSEQTLHIIELAGGWMAAFWMQRIIRHKILKSSYQFGFWAIAVIHQYLSFDYLQSWKYSVIALGYAEKYLQ